MATIQEALERLAPSLEKELQPRLTGFMGAILRSYLPQTWVLHSESETASFTVDPHGKATVTPKAVAGADVTIEATQQILLRALESGRSSTATEKDFHVTFHTKKGKTAFEFLRKRFGF